ncbi:UNVERIFIED_ORG: putative DNA-binding transcriptional regulator AlpA [Enterobacter sp. BIGb0239]|jgi:predicted DNA-binding transcriptional regulator AlpA|uniref:helix-turn-helix transcriptional regulator n=1 Tax=Enterobacteriaceae TaxID=543 RepID=UPI00164F5A01|nr:DNA-binding protein [Lelliottia amnigena]MCE9966883.1 DNA-binding protein [Lelliottia amnigena]HAJ4116473.1 DNA-binding protein [Escherichia coli]HCJ8722701.1 DNA-binding protein [Escherichia coli]
MSTDFMKEEEVMDLLGKKRTALWRLRTKYGFPSPVLTHPSKYSRSAVEKWIREGGVNRAV